jgi:membrane-associated phospholipid phosphatase
MVGLLWLAAFHVGFVERADRKVFLAFYNFPFLYEQHRGAAKFIVALCDPSRAIWLGAVPVVVALARRRARDAGAVLVLLAGASITTLVLKGVLPEPRVLPFINGFPSPVPYPRFPSGHSTVAMSVVLALTLVAPARLRPLIAGLGAIFAAAVGYALLTLGSHYPTDIFGGFLVATTWALLTAVALSTSERRIGRAAGSSRRLSFQEVLTPPIAALISAAVLATVVVFSDPHAVVSYVRINSAFIAGAALIAALSTAVATGVVLSVRR